MDWMVASSDTIHYRQRRPMVTRSMRSIGDLRARLESKTGLAMDCSESVTLLLRLVGCGDPNGLGYDGGGNTQTMFDHLPRYTIPSHAGIGALVFLGQPGQLETQHVCMVRQPGADPLLFSHGQEQGPLYIRLSDERRYHVGGVYFLNVSSL